MITSFFAKKQSTGGSNQKRRLNDVENKPPGGGCSPAKKPRRDTDTATVNSPVDDLISSLQGSMQNASSWKKALSKHFDSSSFRSLANFIAKERATKTIYPPVKDTWSSLNLTPIDEVRVVIVGQDPYHGPRQAHGLCFSVLEGQKIPPSLRNMYKELHQDEHIDNFCIPKHGHLIKWAKQGVLMINSCLTVRKGEANSHQKKGWEVVTDEIIRAVDRHSKVNKKGVVFLLWGKPAAAKASTVISANSKLHHIICTSHPSPLGATKTKSPFMGSKCFSRCNAALKEMGHDPINWSL